MTLVTFGFGDAVPIADDTLIVGGRPMNMQAAQADVASVLIHRAGTTLYLVDTGATADFRPHLQAAIDRLRPFDRVVLVNSHGHADHVGNNGIIDELGVDDRSHYVGRADLALLADNAAYFARAFGHAAQHLPLPFQPDAMAEWMATLFGDLDTRADRVTTLESLPLALLGTGSGSWPGWRLGDDDLYVLTASGHTAGEMVVYLPKVKVLFTADEALGFYPVWPDSDGLKAFDLLTRARRLVEDEGVEAFANGHQFRVTDAEGTASFLDSLIEGFREFDHAVHEALGEAGATVFAVRDAVAHMSTQHGLHGEAENQLYGGMQVLKKLEEMGASATGDPDAAVFRLAR